MNKKKTKSRKTVSSNLKEQEDKEDLRVLKNQVTMDDSLEKSANDSKKAASKGKDIKTNKVSITENKVEDKKEDVLVEKPKRSRKKKIEKDSE